jgi:hypothetical protein
MAMSILFSDGFFSTSSIMRRHSTKSKPVSQETPFGQKFLLKDNDDSNNNMKHC